MSVCVCVMRLKKITIPNSRHHLLLFVYGVLLQTLLWSPPCSSSTSRCELNFDISSSNDDNNNNNETFDSKEFNNCSHLIDSFSLQSPPRNEQTTKNARNLSQALRKTAHSDKLNVQKSIYFYYYKNGKMLFTTSPGMNTTYEINQYVIKSCANEKLSFIFHGWSESCTTHWVPKLMERLTYHRGGCIACVDFSTWSKKSYMQLLQKFSPISEILYEEFLSLIQKGLSASKMYMFGFSYGGQIASKIGRMLKPAHKLKKIDICDMAGPGFDFLSSLNHSQAAENVQCYYSSVDKGSHFHSCHQNIRLGQCGYTQPAVLSQNFSSHGLCNQIYINAFEFPFYALQKPPRFCIKGKTINDLPYGFTVGYKEIGYSHMRGDIFVPTTLNYPYNLAKKEMILYEKYLDGKNVYKKD